MADEVGRINLGLDIDKNLFSKQLSGIAGSANKSVMSAFKPIGKLIGGVLATGSVIAFTKSCIGLGSDLQEVQNVVDVTFSSMSQKVNEFASTAIDRFGLSETVAKKMMGTYGAMTKSFGFTEQQAYDMSEAITGLTADVASFYNLNTDEAYTKMKSIWTGETESLKELGVVMTQTALDQYAINNGFGKTTQAMTEQEKVMLRYQFVQSQLSAASGDFARTSGGWANQIRTLTLRFQQLKATLGQGFINLFTPIVKMLNTFIAKIQSVANAFLRLTEIITGKEAGSLGTMAADTSDVAASAGDASNNISDMGDSAASAAKKAQRALAGFDQINKLSEKDSSGSSSGSGGSTAGASSGTGAITSELDAATTSASKLDAKLTSMVENVKNAWETGDFTNIGKYVGNKINSALENISWDDIKATIKKAASSIATFFNGFIDATDWKKVGSTIAECINTAVLGIKTFLETFNWKKAAAAVADTFNGFMETVDFGDIGEAIADAINACMTTIVTFAKNIDWTLFVEKVGDLLTGFFAKIELGDAALVILGVLSVKLVEKATATLFSTAAEAISLKLGAALLNAGGWGGLATNIFTSIGTALSGAGSAIATLATSIWSAIGTALSTAVSAISTLGSTILTGITTALSGIGSFLTTSVSTVFAGGAASIAAGLFAAIGAAIGGWKIGNLIYDKFSEQIDSIVFKVCDFFTKTIPDALSKAGAAVMDFAVNVKGSIDEKAQDIKNWFADKKEQAKDMWANAKGKVENTFTNLKSAWDGLSDKTSTLTGKAVNYASTVLTTLKDSWNTVKDKVSTLTGKTVNSDKDVLSTLKSGWETIKKKTATLTAKFSNKTGDKFSNMKRKWDGFKTKTATLTAKFTDSFTKPLKAAWNALANSVNKAITTINKIPGVKINGKVPTFAKGGYPEEGPFMMNKGEIAGKFSNGKGVVANNQQITAGIANAVGPSVFQATKSAMQMSLPNIRTPQLSTVTSSSDKTLEKMLNGIMQMASGGNNDGVIAMLKELLEYLKTMPKDVYMDAEKVTGIVTDIINKHTEATGQCLINT